MNIAGIGGYLSDIEREQGLISDFVTFENPKYHSKNVISLGLPKSGFRRRVIPIFHFFKALFNYNTFHFYFGISYLMLGIDLPILKLFGKKIIMTYCGSEIRLLNKVDKKRNPYYHQINFDYTLAENKNGFFRWIKRFFSFRYNSPTFDNRKVWMMRYQKLWVDKFFAIREMFAYASYVIPEEKIIRDIPINNLSLEIVSESDCYKRITDEIPLIVHAPTNQDIKGTRFIEESLKKLKQKGVRFNYKRLENMKFEEVKNCYKNEASIVIDQLLLGSFGSVTVEAMCYGKPVCVYVMDEVSNGICKDVPIYNINIDNIEERIEFLINNPELREKLGRDSRSYVIKNFDRKKIGKKMVALYQSI